MVPCVMFAVGKAGVPCQLVRDHQDLSCPQMHSTAVLQDRIEQLKLAQGELRSFGSVLNPSDKRLRPAEVSLPSSSSNMPTEALPPKVGVAGEVEKLFKEASLKPAKVRGKPRGKFSLGRIHNM